MAGQHKLGIYWGETGVDLVEINKDVPVDISHLSFSELEKDPVVGIKHLTEDLRLLELIQGAVRKGAFSVSNAFLSLPSRDIIARSFLIPWMRAEEVQGVVAFEARKYIPFPLEELVYTYYPSPVNREGVRQIGVALLAIRKTTYERYVNVLVQSGVNVVYSEASAISMIRALAFRKFLPLDKITAVLSTTEGAGEIIITSQGSVRFIRDFRLVPPPETASGDVAEMIRAKLFNEVRMSLDFFSRSNADIDINTVVSVSAGLHQYSLSMLADDIGIPVKTVNPALLLEEAEGVPPMGAVLAYGAALSGQIPQIIDLDLSEGQAGRNARPLAAEPAARPIRFNLAPIALPSRTVMMGLAVVAAVAVLGVSFWFSRRLVEEKRQVRDAVAARLGRYVDMPLQDIESRRQAVVDRVDAIRSVPFRTDMTEVLVRLFSLLPEGVWLESVDGVRRDEPAVARTVRSSGRPNQEDDAADVYQLKTVASLKVSGFVFLGDGNAEFSMANTFLEILRADPLFAARFSTVELQDLRTTLFQDQRKVTVFVINMSGTHGPVQPQR